MRERLRAVLVWCGFTPTQREAYLHAQLLAAAALASEQRLALGRVEVLLHYREHLGADSIDVASLRQALFGERPAR